MGDIFTFDIEDLTIAEVETIEDITGMAIDEAFAPGAKRGKIMRAIAFVVKRREDPDFTLEQAGNLRIALEDETRPTEASGQ